MNRAKMNYWVDLGIGVAFVASAISGMVFLLPVDPAATILGISYQAWNSLHTWSSLVMIAGVGAHLALHWRWMVSMTGQLLSPPKRRAAPHIGPALEQSEGKRGAMSRRTFLTLGGMTAAAAGLLVASQAAFGSEGTGAEDSVQSSSVACPKRLTYDPYPGKCRHYVDRTGDGFCDYSVPN